MRGGSELRIGDLRQRLGLERAARVADGGGGAEETWEMLAEVWAAVLPLAGAERVEADAIAGNVTHEVWLRYRADVTPAMRFRLGKRLFDVRMVIDFEERHRFLKCLCEERDL